MTPALALGLGAWARWRRREDLPPAREVDERPGGVGRLVGQQRDQADVGMNKSEFSIPVDRLIALIREHGAEYRRRPFAKKKPK